MQKKGQVTLFLILGLSLIAVFGAVYYFGGYKTATTAKTQAQAAGSSDAKDIVKSYAENCLKKVTEEVLFNKIGVQGGYINPSEISPAPTFFDGYNVPVYLEVRCNMQCRDKTIPQCGPCPPPSTEQCCEDVRVCDYCWCDCPYTRIIDRSLTLGSINNKLKRYVEDEFENCFDRNVFKNVGIEVIQSGTSITADVSLDAEDVSVNLYYPLTIRKDGTESKLDSFVVTLPIRLEKLYKGAKDFVDQVIRKLPDSSPKPCYPICTVQYDIRQDCQSGVIYNKNRLTNVYAKTADSNTKVIQFFDFSTYLEKYFKSFIFQFAVRLNGVNIEGACTG
ncbi:MAG: hypothetical protein AABX33_05265 [Nanoarchaeota archaeon]